MHMVQGFCQGKPVHSIAQIEHGPIQFIQFNASALVHSMC